jgi:hypothetical protein
MRKITTNKFLAATSLALTVAAFGCTTNRYPGNGEPTSAAPGYGAANQSVTPGSSSGTAGVPPMSSSYMAIAQPNTDAMAEAAAQRGYRGRVLGPVNPGGVQIGVPVQPTGGQVVPPAMIVNPQSTVNPSVSSPGELAVTGGVAGGGGGVSFAGTALATGASFASGSATVGSTAATAPLAVTGAASTSSMATTARATTATSKTARATMASSVRSIAIASPVSIQQNSKGEIVVSNANSVPSTKSSSTTTSVKP